MIGRDALEQLATRGLERSEGHPAEVCLDAFDYRLTRFSDGQVHQNLSMDGMYITARVFDGARSGSACLSVRAPERIEEAVSRALAALRYADVGPERPMPRPEQGYVSPDGSFVDETMLGGTDRWRAEVVQRVVAAVEGRGPHAYGRVITEAGERLVANTGGLVSYAPRTRCDLYVTSIWDTGYGASDRHAYRTADIDPEVAASESAQTCIQARNPKPLPASDYTVVLTPYAVADLIAFIGQLGADANAVQEGRSFLAGKAGEPVLSPEITIWDDGLDAAGRPTMFDAEGVKKDPVTIVRDGLAVGPVHNQATAAREGCRSTGHLPVFSPVTRAFSSPQPGYPALPQNLFLAPGRASVADMVRATEMGLLVRGLHYTRVVEPRAVVITGMTRNGLFLIKGGEIAGPVKNLRFTDSYVRVLNGVSHVGRDAQTCADATGDGLGAIRVPHLRVESLRFTGTTDF